MNDMSFHQGTVRAIDRAVAEETRTVEWIISTYGRDRYRTVLNQDNWKLEAFNKNPIVGYQHNVYGDMCNAPNPDDVIGEGYAYNETGEDGRTRLIGRVKFEPAEMNALAEKVFRKVLHGTLRATSVGFMPFGQGRYGEGDEARGAREQTYYYEGQELLEFSIVNIPGNPEAVGRSLRDHTAHAMMFVRRALGKDYSFADIETMTVRQVLDQLEGQHFRVAEVAEEAAETPQDLDFAAEISRGLLLAREDIDLTSAVRASLRTLK